MSAGDQISDVELSVGTDSVTLVPDVDLLLGEDTAYPVYIDPDADVHLAAYLYVSSAYPSTEYYKFDDTAGVGRCTTYGSAVCSYSAYTNRMYFEFTSSASVWAKRYVRDVTFSAYETWSMTCTASWVKLSKVDPAKVSSATNWNNKPDNLDKMGDRYVSYGRGDLCDKTQPNAWVEFNDNPDETDENLTATVRAALPKGESLAFALLASDETDGNSWKRFMGSNATLSVDFNTKPDAPTNPTTTSPVMNCVTGTGRPYSNDDSPMLHIDADDDDNQNLKATFEVTDMITNSKSEYVTPSKTDTTEFTVQLGGLKHGHRYSWRAKTNDGINDSVGWSPTCEFTVDTVGPSTVPTVSSEVFPAEQWGLKAGEAGTFAFGPNGSSDPVYKGDSSDAAGADGNDVDFYEWAIGNDEPGNKVNPATLGASGSTSITPSTFGANVLYARSVDRAGNRGPLTTYVFKAQRPCEDPTAPTCAAAVFTLDEGTGTTAADTSG